MISCLHCATLSLFGMMLFYFIRTNSCL